MARTINWAAPIDGDFGDAPNWAGGIEPATRQIANLPSFEGSPYTVTFDTSPGSKHGNKPKTIGGLEVGSAVTFDVVDPLNIGSYKKSEGGVQGGKVANEGSINISGAGELQFFAKFVNSGSIAIADMNSLYLADTAASLVNEGEIVLSNGAIKRREVDKGIKNSGTISGAGLVDDLIVNNGLIDSNAIGSFYCLFLG